MKGKIVIIGAGFAGLGAASLLGRQPGLEVTVIDRKKTFDFLPMLPDIIGRGVSAPLLVYPLESAARQMNFRLLHQEVIALDEATGELSTDSQKVKFDYLLIACGCRTNFYGDRSIEGSAFKLDDVKDALNLEQAILKDRYNSILVCGGGYTGIETACSIKTMLLRIGSTKKVILAEKADHILGPLPQWMRAYVLHNLQSMGIEINISSGIEKISGQDVYLNGQRKLDNALIVWCAGVKSAGFLESLDAPKNNQGRLKVDHCLRISPRSFAAGDCALFTPENGQPLRMAVQFSIIQGRTAARNIICLCKGREPQAYKPLDMGFIIPMSNNRSVGSVLGVNLKGWLPTAMHYLMCLYRLKGVGNKMGAVNALRKRLQPFGACCRCPDGLKRREK